MEIGRYLKYGIDKDFLYDTPVSLCDIEWDDAKNKFRNLLRQSVNSFDHNNTIAFCGTLSSCLMMSLIDKNMTTWSVNIGIDTNKISQLLNANNRVAPMHNLEDSLIEVSKLSDFPRSSLEDVYAYSRQKCWSETSRTGLCEGGTDYLLLNSTYNNLMHLAIRRRDYSIKKALKFLSSSTPRMIEDKYYRSYTDLFNDSITIFNDNELMEFGFSPSRIELINDSLEDFLTATWCWGYKTVYEYRTNSIGKHFNFKAFSPFFNDKEMVNFCLSLPIEMKYCLGSSKHILKESIPVPDVIRGKTTRRIFPSIYNTIKSDLELLISKYLKDKNRTIFKHLDYDVVQKHLTNYIKTWNLLSLSVWLEVHS